MLFIIIQYYSTSNIPPTIEAKVLTLTCDATTVTVPETLFSKNVYTVCSNPITCAEAGEHTCIHTYSSTKYYVYAYIYV